MSAARKIVDFPTKNLHHVSRMSPLGKRHKCPYCGFPSATKKGKKLHVTRNHTQNPRADRSWEIFYLNRENGKSTHELAEMFNLSEASIRRIIWRGVAFPGIYELEGGFHG